ncbi:DUF4394 domain-containing protein [Hymenobacter terrenus]|uniref:DUF4394 domain-containing protein n=1 Tax=Hymenobacter terrenus TaxID=1629124 RepID=UPI0009E41B7A|nr:DUF4394 domain-containing protein [Hymenobacter terrenus]
MRQNSTSFRLAAAAGLLILGTQAAQAQTVYGLSVASPTVVNLVTFSAATPGTFTATVPLTGLGAGQSIVGIDTRPNTGELFALGYNPTGTQAQLYNVNRTTGVLTPIGAALTLNLGATPSRIGFDFNPAVDRIRVTSAARTNFRLNPNNGALAATDATLTYAAGDANASQTPGVGSSAYTNSYIGSTATILYNLDEANSRLVTQIPPNDGTQNTVGALGVVTTGANQVSDLDIYFNPTTGTNVAYMTSTIVSGAAAATSTLYTVNLTTGAATAVGALGTGPLVAITDIACAIDRPTTLPAVTGNLAYALAGGNLLTFDTALPGSIRTSVGITGVDATQALVGLDIRPATNRLYALGYNATAQTYQLYTINSTTGVATAVNTTPIALALGTGKVGFDFNPTVDRIRVTSSNRTNVRLIPTDGTIAFTDTQLAYASTDANSAATPNIGAVAYTNSVAGTTAATTTLYNYDLSLNILTTQNPPNAGTLNTTGATGITVNTTTPNVDLDIYSPAAGTNTAYLVANTGVSANTSLYTVNLTTGATTLVGAIGNGIAARDITVAGPTGVPTAARERTDLATGFSLYPNPATSSTRLAFTLARASRVELGVFDTMGRRVTTQTAGLLPAGPQALAWESAKVKAGLYVVRLTVDGQTAATRQVVVE